MVRYLEWQTLPDRERDYPLAIRIPIASLWLIREELLEELEYIPAEDYARGSKRNGLTKIVEALTRLGEIKKEAA